MRSEDYFSLFSGADLETACSVHIRQPTLHEIRTIGIDRYLYYLSVFTLDRNSIKAIFDLGKLSEIIGAENTNKLTTFDLLVTRPDFRERLFESLSFFVREELVETADHLNFATKDASVLIGNESFEDICLCVLRTAHIPTDDRAPVTFKSDRSRAIYEKLQAGRQKMKAKTSENKNMHLGNLVAAVCAKHGGYTALNIWGLTVFQLYDQFERINAGVQMDIYGSRWAAWGKEPFDTSMWFADVNIKNKENTNNES